MGARKYFTQFRANLFGADRAFLRSDQIVSRFIESRFTTVNEKTGCHHGRSVDLSGLGRESPYRVDVRTQGNPFVLQDWFATGRSRHDYVGAAHSGFSYLDWLNRNRELRLHFFRELLRAFQAPTGNTHAANLTNACYRAQMRARLYTGANDCEVACVIIREHTSCQRADRGGTNGCYR